MNGSPRTTARHQAPDPRARGTRYGWLPTQLGAPLADAGPGGSPGAASMTGLAWLVIALAAGTLAAQQWAYDAPRSQLLGFELSAVANAGVAVAAVVLGLVLLVRPSRTAMALSAALGVVVIAVIFAQVVMATASTWLWFGIIVIALLATVASFAGRGQAPGLPPGLTRDEQERWRRGRLEEALDPQARPRG